MRLAPVKFIKPMLMKSILLIAWLLFSSSRIYAQTQEETALPVDTETKRVTYTGVVAVAGADKNELYTRAKLWASLTYDQVQDVIKVDEKEAGLLVLRAYTDLPVAQTSSQPTNYELGYTMLLNFKDGRYKYTITNYQVINGNSTGTLENEIVALLSKPKNKGIIRAKQCRDFVASLARALTQSVDVTLQKPVSGNNEW
jgi:hypothetical protein